MDLKLLHIYQNIKKIQQTKYKYARCFHKPIIRVLIMDIVRIVLDPVKCFKSF